jgi:hypothetical protein
MPARHVAYATTVYRVVIWELDASFCIYWHRDLGRWVYTLNGEERLRSEAYVDVAETCYLDQCRMLAAQRQSRPHAG